MINPAQLEGHVPIRVYWRQSRPMIDWCYLGTERLTDSFFDQTISRCLRRPFNLLFRPQTPVETLRERAASDPGLSPTGFIFHMSRCGSTLVSQMLAALPRNMVISEAGPIDAMIRAHFHAPHLEVEEQIAWIQAMMSVMARPNHAGQNQFFVKFDCINTLSLPLIRRAFPRTPWIFLFRNPLEVLVSQFRQRGGLLLPGALEPELLGLAVSVLGQMSLNEYCAALLARICEAALDHFPSITGRLVDYRELPGAVGSSIATHFRISHSAEEIDHLRQTSQFHAKHPHFEFSTDSETKQKEASAEVRQLVDRWLAGPWARLEARHRDQSRRDSLTIPVMNQA
jgi:hypothetical protein